MVAMPLRLLHVVPAGLHDPKLRFHGSTKDILGRIEYFGVRDIAVTELDTGPRHNDRGLLQALNSVPLKTFDTVLLEYPRFPRSIAHIRKENPQARILVRGHNAEFLHQVHLIAGEALLATHQPLGESVKRWRPMARALRDLWVKSLADRACARLADAVLSISDWETQRYWRRLTSNERIFTVPYFLPTVFHSGTPAAAVARKSRCVCLTSAVMNPLVAIAAYNFIRAIAGLGGRMPDWSFGVTGDVPGRFFENAPRITRLGRVENPLAELRSASATALLSSLGTGFKTKILDAVQEGCYTLVPLRLFDRLPGEIRPFCLPVDLGNVDSLATALETSKSRFPSGDPNGALRSRAFAALDRAIGL
jgi:hypothetical protein